MHVLTLLKHYSVPYIWTLVSKIFGLVSYNLIVLEKGKERTSYNSVPQSNEGNYFFKHSSCLIVIQVLDVGQTPHNNRFHGMLKFCCETLGVEESNHLSVKAKSICYLQLFRFWIKRSSSEQHQEIKVR